MLLRCLLKCLSYVEDFKTILLFPLQRWHERKPIAQLFTLNCTTLTSEKLGCEMAKYFWPDKKVDARLTRQGILKAMRKEVTEEDKEKETLALFPMQLFIDLRMPIL